MDSTDLLGLPEASIEVVQQYRVESDHRRLWGLVTSGRVPATRIRGRWYIRRSDLGRVAEALRPAARADAA